MSTGARTRNRRWAILGIISMTEGLDLHLMGGRISRWGILGAVDGAEVFCQGLNLYARAIRGFGCGKEDFFARRMEEDDQTLTPAQIDLSYYDQFGSLNLVLLNGDKLPDKQEVLKEALVEIFNSKKGNDGFTISKSLGEIEGRHEELLNEAQLAAAAEEKEAHSFEIDPAQVENIKQRCLPNALNYPMLEEYDFRNDTDCSCCTLIAEKFALTSPETLGGRGFSRLLELMAAREKIRINYF